MLLRTGKSLHTAAHTQYMTNSNRVGGTREEIVARWSAAKAAYREGSSSYDSLYAVKEVHNSCRYLQVRADKPYSYSRKHTSSAFRHGETFVSTSWRGQRSCSRCCCVIGSSKVDSCPITMLAVWTSWYVRSAPCFGAVLMPFHRSNRMSPRPATRVVRQRLCRVVRSRSQPSVCCLRFGKPWDRLFAAWTNCKDSRRRR